MISLVCACLDTDCRREGYRPACASERSSFECHDGNRGLRAMRDKTGRMFPLMIVKDTTQEQKTPPRIA